MKSSPQWLPSVMMFPPLAATPRIKMLSLTLLTFSRGAKPARPRRVASSTRQPCSSERRYQTVSSVFELIWSTMSARKSGDSVAIRAL